MPQTSGLRVRLGGKARAAFAKATPTHSRLTGFCRRDGRAGRAMPTVALQIPFLFQ